MGKDLPGRGRRSIDLNVLEAVKSLLALDSACCSVLMDQYCAVKTVI